MYRDKKTGEERRERTEEKSELVCVCERERERERERGGNKERPIVCKHMAQTWSKTMS